MQNVTGTLASRRRGAGPKIAPLSPELERKEEQEWLDREALHERRTDGGYNTTVAARGKGDCLWRVSKGTDKPKRVRHLLDWIEEAELTKFFGKLGIAPQVFRDYSDMSKWLVRKQKRVAILQRRYTEDLSDALFESKAKVYLGDDANFGAAAGKYLVRRCCQLGAACMLHADLKPENVLVMLKSGGASGIVKKVAVLNDLRIIDFDPQFLYAGCRCVASALRRLNPPVSKEMLPELQSALFALLNLILLWAWFEVDATTETTRDPAVTACHKVLTSALENSSFPLESAALVLPEVMGLRLETWEKNYREKPLRKAKKAKPALSVVLAAAARFRGLRDFTWEEGPKVAGVVYRAPQALCCGSPSGQCSFDVKEIEKDLTALLEKIPGMTCSAKSPQLKSQLKGTRSPPPRPILGASRLRAAVQDTRSSPNYRRRIMTLRP